jgi:hypothetical protein
MSKPAGLDYENWIGSLGSEPGGIGDFSGTEGHSSDCDCSRHRLSFHQPFHWRQPTDDVPFAIHNYGECVCVAVGGWARFGSFGRFDLRDRERDWSVHCDKFLVLVENSFQK